MRELICVLGMHRSGTSMLCEILQGFGIYFGEAKELYGGDEYNKDGYFEIKEIRLIYDKIFKELHSSWRASALLADEELETWSEREYYEGWLCSVLSTRLTGQEGKAGFKEPSTSLLLPVMKKVWKRLRMKTQYAIMVRSPKEVAASLKRREGMEEGQAVRLWMKYYISILKHTAGERVSFFHKEQFMRDKEKVFHKLDNEFFGGRLTRQGETEQSLAPFIKREYFHAVSHEEVSAARGNALAEEMYAYLQKLCEGEEIIEECYEKALYFETRYKETEEQFALWDAYAEMEYRKEQMQSFAIWSSFYEQWLKVKVYGVNVFENLRKKGMKKIGVYGEENVCEFLLKECENAGMKAVRLRLPKVERVDLVILAAAGLEEEVKKTKRLIRHFLYENKTDCGIATLQELLQKAWEQEAYKEACKRRKASKRVLIFRSQSLCYSSTDYFADCLAKEFAKAGYTPEVLVLSGNEKGQLGEKDAEKLEETLEKEYFAVLDFNSNLPSAVLEDGSYYLDRLCAPFYNILLDHPLYFHAALKENIKDYRVCCIDKNHVEYVKKYYPHIKESIFFPLAGIYCGSYEELKPFEERKMELFLPATYKNTKEYEAEIALTIPEVQEGIWYAVGLLKENPAMPLEEALEKMLEVQELDCLDKNGRATMFHAHFLIDMYMNAWYREQVVRTLLEQGVSLYVCGEGWENFLLEEMPTEETVGAERGRLHILPAVEFKETGEMMEDAKIVLNIVYAFKNGCHDRMLTTMLAGAVSVSAANPYIEENFNSEELCCYDLAHWDKLAELLKQLLSKPEQLRKLSRNGYEKAVREHTWEVRAAKFIPK